ncbi:MAG: BMP family ABC transporter substrate-binding protein [Bacilli bacterium]|nr:BMP family ABC transporter substrate-binding protein [Bacilli bacterium]
MKKFFKLVLVLVLCVCSVFALSACESKGKVKVGLICLHDESSTYDKNFIDSMYRALDELGLKASALELVTGIGEDNSCYEKACELASTCDIVFADSFGHEPYMLKAAKENPDTIFCHATGTQAHTAGVENYYNAFASIYEGRYLAGIAAGMKLNEMIEAGQFTALEAMVGYVGAFPYAEVVSGYTSFFLGVRSVCPTATMVVRYTSSWYDYDKEYAAANALIASGCKLISQHADSYGAPTACEEKNVPNVTYNGSTVAKCPNTYIVSSKIDWAPYYVKMITAVMNGEKVAEKDYVGTIATGSVKLDAVGSNAAAGTQEAIDAAKAKLQAGTLHVFDTSTFTVGLLPVTSYKADVDDAGDYVGETEVIANGYFHESEYRSAPYFDLRIDGIRELND